LNNNLNENINLNHNKIYKSPHNNDIILENNIDHNDIEQNNNNIDFETKKNNIDNNTLENNEHSGAKDKYDILFNKIFKDVAQEKADLENKEVKITIDLENNNNRDNNIVSDIEQILNFENYLYDKIMDFSNSLGYTSRFNSIDITKKNMQSIIEDDKSNLNDKEKIENKQVERLTQSFCEDILESFEDEFENSIKNSAKHKFMNEVVFHERHSKNQRFCGFCVIKKVKNFFIKNMKFFLIR